MRIPTFLCCTLTLLTVLAWPAQAGETLRCGSKLVGSGDSRALVRARCGVPDDVSSSTILRRAFAAREARRTLVGAEQLVEVQVEQWVYNFGPNRLMRRLKFVDGILEDIETLDYGYHPSEDVSRK
jgi:hypothetical protein